MTAAPRPNPPFQRGTQSSSLTDALTEQARVRADLAQLKWVIDEAIDSGALHLVFPWVTHDDRDADIFVYYQPGGAAKILAVELDRIDGRPPTARERLEYETAFASEIDAAGATWEMVASYIWEREDSDEC